MTELKKGIADIDLTQNEEIIEEMKSRSKDFTKDYEYEGFRRLNVLNPEYQEFQFKRRLDRQKKQAYYDSRIRGKMIWLSKMPGSLEKGKTYSWKEHGNISQYKKRV